MMISKPLIVVLMLKLLVLRDGEFNIPVLFTVNLAMILINMQAILNALAYIDTIKNGLDNIQVFIQQDEMNSSHVQRTH